MSDYDRPGLAEKYIDLAGSIFLVLDREGTVSMINPRGCEILGLEKEKIIGKNWIETFIPEHQREHILSIHQSNLNNLGEDRSEVENTVVTSDGGERTILWKNTLLRDESGHVVGTLSSGTDISERKQIEDQLRRRINEMERFVKATVGREKRIAELKQKVKDLEAQGGV